MTYKNILLIVVLTAALGGFFPGSVLAEDVAEVEFSGVVKKVILDKNKVAIQEPETKKRFTLTLDENTRLTGYASIGDIQKKDKVSGSYLVTPAGVYLAKSVAAAK